MSRAGPIEHFTAIGDPHDEPDGADITLDTSVLAPEEAFERLAHLLQRHRWLPQPARKG